MNYLAALDSSRELPAAISGGFHPVAERLHTAPSPPMVPGRVVKEKLGGGIPAFSQAWEVAISQHVDQSPGATSCGKRCNRSALPLASGVNKKGRRSYAQHRSLRIVIANYRGSVFRFHSLQISSILQIRIQLAAITDSQAVDRLSTALLTVSLLYLKG